MRGEGLAKDVLKGLGLSTRHEIEVLDRMEEFAVMDFEAMKVTPRDQQVLELLVQGCNNKEIACQLSISPRTVKQHLRTLFLRAGIRDGRKRVKLAIAAFEKQAVNS
jgi:DNA-binding NarL/FixJ family response regulator